MSTMTAQVLKWNSPKTISSIALGAYFRDIGLIGKLKDYDLVWNKKIDPSISQVYLDHPLEGYLIVKRYFEKERTEEMNRFVLDIILQHHEDGTISGFPKQMSFSKIYPPALPVSLVDSFLIEYYSIIADNTQIRLSKSLHSLKSKFEGDLRLQALELLLTKGDINIACRFFEAFQNNLKITVPKGCD
ncbi:MAG: hypothetical protein HQK51_18305 [Oligoflexia bacterium]|nr:hypothetical protein [Oligoflexia bacterium]